jgi:chromosome segregation ATPase
LKQIQRQLNQEIQNAASAKRELNDYQLRMSRLQDEINTLKGDKEQFNSLISSLQQRVKFHLFLFLIFIDRFFCLFSLQMKKI